MLTVVIILSFYLPLYIFLNYCNKTNVFKLIVGRLSKPADMFFVVVISCKLHQPITELLIAGTFHAGRMGLGYMVIIPCSCSDLHFFLIAHRVYCHILLHYLYVLANSLTMFPYNFSKAQVMWYNRASGTMFFFCMLGQISMPSQKVSGYGCNCCSLIIQISCSVM